MLQNVFDILYNLHGKCEYAVISDSKLICIPLLAYYMHLDQVVANNVLKTDDIEIFHAAQIQINFEYICSI